MIAQPGCMARARPESRRPEPETVAQLAEAYPGRKRGLFSSTLPGSTRTRTMPRSSIETTSATARSASSFPNCEVGEQHIEVRRRQCREQSEAQRRSRPTVEKRTFP